ncbi:glycosyl hydrolase family 8 [Aliidiomarina sp.]|uniref:glycosyl hydrolase family 8 n=1 Tax=Aliidiomarina sp. TaxID=1872439 RepID=UPI003A4DFB84
MASFIIQRMRGARSLAPLLIAMVALSMLSACSPADCCGNEPEATSQRSSAFAVNEQTPAALRFNWHYQRFLEHLVNEDGRVIDEESEESISTSEGQAYGMWFALLAQDQTQFDLMLTWADRNLAQGALGDKLPAWLWGEDEDGTWHILENNSASDADIWITYALYAAAELWQQPRYAALATRLSRRLLSSTTIVLGTESPQASSLNTNGVTTTARAEGLVLLPAPQGFTHDGYVMVNPSYFNFMQLRGLAAYSGDERWQEIYKNSVNIMQQLAHEGHGMVPDWLTLDYAGNLLSVGQTPRHHQNDVRYGEYDAIRTYLWLAQDQQLLNQFLGMHEVVVQQGYPPERLSRPVRQFVPHPDNPNTRINIIEGARGRGPIGFSGALLPYLIAIEGEQGESVREQAARIVAANPNDYRNGYYTQSLIMFGLSTLQCTEFDTEGRLVVSQEVLNGCT